MHKDSRLASRGITREAKLSSRRDRALAARSNLALAKVASASRAFFVLAVTTAARTAGCQSRARARAHAIGST